MNTLCYIDLSTATRSLNEVMDVAIIEKDLVHHRLLAPVHFVQAFMARPSNMAGRVLKKHNERAADIAMMGDVRTIVGAMEEVKFIRPLNSAVQFAPALQECINAAFALAEEESGPGAKARTDHMLHAIINAQDSQCEQLFNFLDLNQFMVQAELKRDREDRPAED